MMQAGNSFSIPGIAKKSLGGCRLGGNVLLIHHETHFSVKNTSVKLNAEGGFLEIVESNMNIELFRCWMNLGNLKLK